MAKLQDMFTQVRRAQGGGGMGFLGKSKSDAKARSIALVVELTTVTPGSAEAALKAGADGLLFKWDISTGNFETLKGEIEAARGSKEEAVIGLDITKGWDTLDQDSLREIIEQGIQYIVLPFQAPARLLALEAKDLEKVVTIPMREGEVYPLYIRNLTAFDGISAVVLDFGLSDKIGSMSIEQILDYLAVREAVRYPSFLHVKGTLTEADAFAISMLGVQALVLATDTVEEETREGIKNLRALLEKVYEEEEKEKKKDSAPGLPSAGHK